MKKMKGFTVALLACLLSLSVCACAAAQTTLVGIEITAAPAKTVYETGERFDASGMTVTATYSDGAKKTVTDYTVTPSGALTAEDESVTVAVSEGGVTKTASLPISVHAPSVIVERIEITVSPDKKVYFSGERFDGRGLILTAFYSDDSSAVVTGYTTEPDRPLTTEDKEIRFGYTYGGATVSVTQEIAVQAREMVSLRVRTPPKKTEYVDGEAFEKAGMVVEAAYNDASAAVVEDYSIDKTALSLSDSTVTVSVGVYSATVGISVRKSALQRIDVKRESVRTYLPGDAFDRTTVTVTAVHGAGALEKEYTVTDYTVSPEEITRETESVRLSYTFGDVTVSDDFGVAVKVPKELRFSGSPVKQRSGYAFDPTGLNFSVLFSNEETEPLSADLITFEGGITSRTTQVTATYANEALSVPIPVTVEAVPEKKSVAPAVATYTNQYVTTPPADGKLITNATNIRYSFLTFDYLADSADVDAAVLRLTVSDLETKSQDRPFRDYYRTLSVYAVDYAQVTADLLWSNQPTFGDLITVFSVPPIPDGIVEVDLSEFVKANMASRQGKFAFAIANRTDTQTDKSTISFYDASSKEHAPELLFTKGLPAASVAVAARTLTVNEGAVLNLGASVVPFYATDKTLKYESADSSVAAVDGDGNVTGVSVGQTEITVTPAAGDSAKVTVAVNEAVEKGESVFVSGAGCYVQQWDKDTPCKQEAVLKVQASCAAQNQKQSLGNERRSFLSIDYSALLGVGKVKSAVFTVYLAEAATHAAFKQNRYVDIDAVTNFDVTGATYWNQRYTDHTTIDTVTVLDGAAAGTAYTVDLTEYINGHLPELNGTLTLMLSNRSAENFTDANAGGNMAVFHSSGAADAAVRPKLSLTV